MRNWSRQPLSRGRGLAGLVSLMSVLLGHAGRGEAKKGAPPISAELSSVSSRAGAVAADGRPSRAKPERVDSPKPAFTRFPT